jgi:hypothetical protein
MAGVIRIQGRHQGEAWQADAAIAAVGPDWYADTPEGRALNLRRVGDLLRMASETCARELGERLHHADWTITSDPGEVRRLGLTHDCDQCREGVDRAVAWLGAGPGREVAVGQMWWTVNP